MLISAIKPDQIGNNPIFNLSAIAKTANPQTKSSDTLDWLQTQENTYIKPGKITAYVDKFSNVFVKDFAIFKSYLLHCMGGDINAFSSMGV